MGSWRIKVATIVVAAGTSALLSWPGSHACQAEDQEQTEKGAAAEEAVIEVESIPHYTELLEWTNDVKRRGFELLKAAKQNGYLIAVFKTEDGDVAICYRRLEEKTVANPLQVTDLDRNDLADESESHHARPLVRTLKTPVSTIRFLDGIICPLRKPVPTKVRVILNEGVGEIEAGLAPDRLKTIFSEVIEME